MQENNFADGLYINPPHEKAPDFVVGSISIRATSFLDWLQRQEPNEKGYVRLDILKKKNGEGWYAKLNDYDYDKKKFMTDHQGDNMEPSSDSPF